MNKSLVEGQCYDCKGAGYITIAGSFRDQIKICPGCNGELPPKEEFKITSGVPIPKHVLPAYRKKLQNSKKMYPWEKMEEGDFVEIDIKGKDHRASVVRSLRMFQKHHPGYFYTYVLERDKETGQQSISIWRLFRKDIEEELA